MNKRSGFTIVELLVVIVVIGILAAITIVSYTGISQKATVASIQSDLDSNAKLLKMYYTIYGTYPVGADRATAFDSSNCPKAPNVVDSKYCLKLSGSNSIDSYYSTGQSFSLIIKNGDVKYSSTDQNGPVAVVDWINGRIGSILEGDQVYKVDSANSQWAAGAMASCSDPWCAQNLDSYYSNAYSLVTDNNVDFSDFPARDTCKTLGGRLPYTNELLEIYNHQPMYGDNFNSTSRYWTGTGDYDFATTILFSSGFVGQQLSPQSFSIRCVKGSPKVSDGWIDGLSGGALNGKHVYHVDLSDKIWGPTSVCPTASDGSKQCSLNLDPSYMAYPTLVSPQTYPAVDFSSYPAQDSCKTIGGRLPNTVELAALRDAYLNGTFGYFADGNYWSATDSPGISFYLNLKTNSAGSASKSSSYHVRCIKD